MVNVAHLTKVRLHFLGHVYLLTNQLISSFLRLLLLHYVWLYSFSYCGSEHVVENIKVDKTVIIRNRYN